MKYLKITISLLLAVTLTACLCSCGKSGRMTFENAMLAIQQADFTKLRTFITEDSAGTLASAEKYYSEINDLSRETYAGLLSLVEFSYASQDTASGDRLVLHINLTHIDTVRIINDVAARISVSGASAWHEIDTMIADGTVEKNYLVTDDVDVILADVGGRWLLPYDTDINEALLTSLGTINFLRWFAAQQK